MSAPLPPDVQFMPRGVRAASGPAEAAQVRAAMNELRDATWRLATFASADALAKSFPETEAEAAALRKTLDARVRAARAAGAIG